MNHWTFKLFQNDMLTKSTWYIHSDIKNKTQNTVKRQIFFGKNFLFDLENGWMCSQMDRQIIRWKDREMNGLINGRQPDKGDAYLLPHTTPRGGADVCCPDRSCSPQSWGARGHTDRTWRGAGSPQTGPGSTPEDQRCSHWPSRRRTGPALGGPLIEPVVDRNKVRTGSICTTSINRK